jgi:uncharacterized ParB-like nuclease family protein
MTHADADATNQPPDDTTVTPAEPVAPVVAAALPADPPPPDVHDSDDGEPDDEELLAGEGDSDALEPEGGDDDDASPEPTSSGEHEVPRHFTAPAQISLERVLDDVTFCVRPTAELDDVSVLATDIARLGQLFPIDVRLSGADGFQIITGFRRVAALKFLQRERVLARLHTDLSDEDAMLMALAASIHSAPVSREALAAVRERLDAEGKLTPASRDMLDKALATEDGLSPESVDEEVDADELASDVTVRLGQCNQDLSLLADVFGDLDDQRREQLLTQLKYSIDLVAFLEGKQ